jgi:hypothetical protein
MFYVEYSTGTGYYYRPIECETFEQARSTYREKMVVELAKPMYRRILPRVLAEGYDDEWTGLTVEQQHELDDLHSELMYPEEP